MRLPIILKLFIIIILWTIRQLNKMIIYMFQNFYIDRMYYPGAFFWSQLKTVVSLTTFIFDKMILQQLL